MIIYHSQFPSGRLKTSGFALDFQHFPRDLVNVNEWKIMFDLSIKVAELSNCVILDHVDNKQTL